MDYKPPKIVDYGSLETLTAACDAPGGGDNKFPDTHHTTQILDSENFCISN